MSDNFITVEKQWYNVLLETYCKYNNLVQALFEEKFPNYDWNNLSFYNFDYDIRKKKKTEEFWIGEKRS